MLRERYINPFTDFGFERIFGSELNLEELFGVAEIAKLDRSDLQAYEESLKVYRDLKNVIDTAYDEGKAEGIIEVARRLKAKGFSTPDIAEATGLTHAQIDALRPSLVMAGASRGRHIPGDKNHLAHST